MVPSTKVKATVAMLIVSILLTAGMPLALSIHDAPSTQDRGWYWKPAYPNYAPSGMPDFDQKQDNWKKITAGPNGVVDSVIAGDDVFNAQENCIAPGNNAQLDSAVVGDDVAKWCYCGPVAVANCLWWFDSKYEDPDGTPGDGQNEFNLVTNYGPGDDHSKANAPELIKKLANAMQTTNRGTTSVSDMQTGLDDWFDDTGLTTMFNEQAWDNPTFENVSSAITACQDVILLLSDYTQSQGELLVDQAQPLFNTNDNLQPINWNDYQSFVPTATRLDAIDIFLVSNGGPCDVQVNVYDAQSTLLGSSVVNPGNLPAPVFIRFPFAVIPLTPGATYYFDVKEVPTPDAFHYEWFYFQGAPDMYPPGQGWKDGSPVTLMDWTFFTLYFNPILEKTEGHFVTCAGVDISGLQIAFSDPDFDVKNPAATDHNDAKNVSHDEYDVVIGSPDPGINCTWYIDGYPVSANYTVVEAAIVICPTHGLTPNLSTQGSLSWTDVVKGSTVTGSFKVLNTGDTGSRLDWKIVSWPDWGTWTFTPSSGDNLKPEDGAKDITVTVVAPDAIIPLAPGETFSGNVTVVNAENASDVCHIPISMTTPLRPAHPFWDWLLSWFQWLERLIYPNA